MEFRGAEATVRIEEDRVVKERNRKKYRDEELDSRLREERTSEELRNLERAKKYGVNVPRAEKTSETSLELEKVEGKQLKKVIDSEPGAMEELGENIAKMHSADVIHGDLTTSNIIWNDELFIIDFGLSKTSERIEDRAVDIHLLKQVLESSHPEHSENAWKNFLGGYENYAESEKVLKRLEKVESRGRYK